MARLDTVPNGGRWDMRHGRRSLFATLTHLTIIEGYMGHRTLSSSLLHILLFVRANDRSMKHMTLYQALSRH